MTTAIIVQARMSSTRLPGKVLLPIMGRPMLAYQLERLQRVTLADVLVVATTPNATDDPVAALAESMGCVVVRGSEDDVLARFWQAANEVDADVIVRVTADCPIIEPETMDRCLHELVHAFAIGGVDYLVPVGEPDGNTMEVFTVDLLRRLHELVTDPTDRQHVTLAAVRDPDAWGIRVSGSPSAVNRQYTRWTVDTAADFELIRRIFEALYPTNQTFTIADIADLIARHPEWAAINGAVVQDFRAEDSAMFTRATLGNPWLAR
jgi:spore coat polysaccharide biosynthesis protein SpsF